MRTIAEREMRGILESLKNQAFHVDHIADDPEEVIGNKSIHYFGKGFEAVEVSEGFSLDFTTYGQVRYVDNYIDGMFEAALFDDYTVGGGYCLTVHFGRRDMGMNPVLYCLRVGTNGFSGNIPMGRVARSLMKLTV